MICWIPQGTSHHSATMRREIGILEDEFIIAIRCCRTSKSHLCRSNFPWKPILFFLSCNTIIIGNGESSVVDQTLHFSYRLGKFFSSYNFRQTLTSRFWASGHFSPPSVRVSSQRVPEEARLPRTSLSGQRTDIFPAEKQESWSEQDFRHHFLLQRLWQLSGSEETMHR